MASEGKVCVHCRELSPAGASPAMMRAQFLGGSPCARAGSAAMLLALVMFFPSCRRSTDWEQLREKEGRYYQKSSGSLFSGLATKRFPGGRTSATYSMRDGKLHGKSVFYFHGGSKRMEIPYRNGLEHGTARGWHPSGKKSFTCQYQAGKRVGQSIQWHENGKKQLEVEYRNGLLHGRWLQWHANGVLQRETSYLQDEEHGEHWEWYASGRSKFRAQYARGKIHGVEEAWLENGAKAYEKHFHEGKPNGLWTKWHRNGVKELELCFVDGRHHGTQAGWHENGAKKFQYEADIGVPCGTWRSWYGHGGLRSSGSWDGGKLNGRWLRYGDSGACLEEIDFLEGRRTRIFQWHPSGKRKLEARCRKNGKEWEWRLWKEDGGEEMKKDQPFYRGLYPWFFSAPRQKGDSLGTDQVRTLGTLRQVDDYPVMTMTYHGDYGLNRFLSGPASEHWDDWQEFSSIQKEGNCSSFMVRSRGGGIYFGRNWDFKRTSYLVLFTAPPDGYASVSLVHIPAMGETGGNPALEGFIGKKSFLRAPFFPLEGMNERGLAIACMHVDGEYAGEPQKPTVSLEQMIRVILDHAATVGEAGALFRNYNTLQAESQHYLVADRSGRSAVVECRNGEVVLVPSLRPWQAATNSLVFGRSEESIRKECWRYRDASAFLNRTAGSFTWRQGMQLLEGISLAETPETIASTVYDLKSGELFLAVGRNFNKIIELKLSAKYYPAPPFSGEE
jgi:antitoxin component YwqK of YwqJK toxin-antitoxin module